MQKKPIFGPFSPFLGQKYFFTKYGSVMHNTNGPLAEFHNILMSQFQENFQMEVWKGRLTRIHRTLPAMVGDLLEIHSMQD